MYAKRIANKINAKGELVTITQFSEPTYSDYGDLIENTSEIYENVMAVFNQYGTSSEYQTEGNFLNGHVTFFFKAGQKGLFINNLITRANGEVWKITQVYKNAVSGIETHIECRVTNSEL